MPTYVHNGTAFQELTGTDQPFVNVAGTFQGVKNVYVYASGAWRTVYEYDITAPTIPTPTVVNATTSHTVSWTALSDNASGVVSATLYQRFVGSTSGDVVGSSYVLPSFGAGSTSLSVPLNRRKQGAGESWSAYYYIVATDAAGNTGTGANSASMATTPYDIVNPTIASLSAVDTTASLKTDSGMQRVTWGALADDNTGVASATLRRWFYDSNGTWQGEESWNIVGSLGGSYLDLSVPTNRRKQGSGVTWYAYYRVTVTDNAGNIATADAGGYVTKAYDVVAPTVPIPTVTSGGSSDTISWTAVTDDNTGVASATLYQAVYNVTANTYTNKYASVAIGTGGASSTTMSIPNAIRNTPTGDHYQVYYWISATDNAGNKVDGDQVSKYSAFVNTKPLGTYLFAPTSANTRNIGDTAWLTPTTEGMVGVSTTRAYGCWFYGDNTIKNACKGWDANSGTIFVKRCAGTDPNRGNTGTFYLMTHDLGSAGATGATFGGTVLEQYLSGDNASAYKTLDATAISRLRSGAGQGFGLQGHSFSPGFLLGMRDYSGLITLVYN